MLAASAVSSCQLRQVTDAAACSVSSAAAALPACVCARQCCQQVCSWAVARLTCFSTPAAEQHAAAGLQQLAAHLLACGRQALSSVLHSSAQLACTLLSHLCPCCHLKHASVRAVCMLVCAAKREQHCTCDDCPAVGALWLSLWRHDQARSPDVASRNVTSAAIECSEGL